MACRGLNFPFVYLDDILVAGTTERAHIAPTIGHRISPDGSVPLTVKVDAISNFPQPTTVKGLQEFVGMIHFYNHFVPAAAQVIQLPYQALADKPRTFIWSADMTSALQGAKQALAQAILLHHPTEIEQVSVTVNASAVAMGASLEQWSQVIWKPIAFLSKQLRTPELKYSVFDRELLALYLVICHFCFFLEGRPFVAFTDHNH